MTALMTQLAAIQLATALLQATHVLVVVQLQHLHAQKFVETGLSLQTNNVMITTQLQQTDAPTPNVRLKQAMLVLEAPTLFVSPFVGMDERSLQRHVTMGQKTTLGAILLAMGL